MSKVLDRLRNSHHKPAQLFASGYSVSEIAVLINRDESSIADLELDPTFRGLVQHYRDKNNGNEGN